MVSENYGMRTDSGANWIRTYSADARPSSGVATLHIHEAMPSSLALEICGFMNHPDRPDLGFGLFKDALQRYSFEGIQRMTGVFHDGSVAEWQSPL